MHSIFCILLPQWYTCNDVCVLIQNAVTYCNSLCYVFCSPTDPIRQPSKRSLANYTSTPLPPKRAKVVRHAQPVPCASTSSAEQEIVKMKRAEHVKKLTQMDEEHKYKMDILVIKKKIAQKKLEQMYETTSTGDYSSVSSGDLQTYQELF